MQPDRKAIERDHFEEQADDAKRRGGPAVGLKTIRPALRAPYELVDRWMARNAAGKVLMDYGTGLGMHIVGPARHGAKVVGLDISPGSCEVAAELCRREGVGDRASFVVGDAETLPFADRSLDVVMSFGTLPTLNVDTAASELARVTKRQGSVVIVDTLGHNPVLNFYRRGHLRNGRRTRWEVDHILRFSDIDRLRQRFARAEVHYFDFLTLPFYPLAGRADAETPGWLRVVQRIDRWLLGLPGLNRLAFKFVCILSEPIGEERRRAPADASEPKLVAVG